GRGGGPAPVAPRPPVSAGTRRPGGGPPATNGPSNLTPNHSPNSLASDRACQTRAREALSRTCFSIRSVTATAICNLQVAHRTTSGPRMQPRGCHFVAEADDESSLPYERNQPDAYPAHVVRVPGQISLQDFLLVEEPPHEHGHEGHDEAERPPRTERERKGDEQPDGAGVHGVTHVRVRSTVDHRLVLLHANVRCGETVDPDHPENEEEGQNDQHGGENREPRRDRRPPVSVIERGQDHQRKEREEDQRDDDFLGPLLLMLRPGLHPALEKRSVVDRQVHGEGHGDCGKRPEEEPALPVVERAGRPEDEHDKEKEPEHALDNRLSVERIHEARLYRSNGRADARSRYSTVA